MTGLDADRHALLEIATILTNYELEIVDHGPVFAIKTPLSKLRSMDAWAKRTHKRSGLLDRVVSEGVPMRVAEAETLKFVRAHCAAGTAPLCGNSVWQDKRFLSRYMPALQKHLHYRIVDVSSVKVLVQHWFPNAEPAPRKENTHTALLDIEESIAELRHYRRILTESAWH